MTFPLNSRAEDRIVSKNGVNVPEQGNRCLRLKLRRSKVKVFNTSKICQSSALAIHGTQQVMQCKSRLSVEIENNSVLYVNS